MTVDEIILREILNGSREEPSGSLGAGSSRYFVGLRPSYRKSAVLLRAN
jgi:hypothetical protein